MARRRRRGEGSVFLSKSETAKEGRPVWVARVSLGTRNGKRVQHKARAATEKLAKAKLERLQAAYVGGGDIGDMTLDAYLAEWLQGIEPTVRPSTMKSYRLRVGHVTGLLGGIPVAKLRPSDVRRLIADRLRAGLSPTTVGHIVIALRTALEAARRERQIPDNVAMVKLPRVETEPVAAITLPEARLVLAAVADHPYVALYVLLLNSGLRIGEAVGLDWRDVDLDGATVLIRRGKTASSVRRVDLSEDAVGALRTHRVRSPRVGPREPVFLGAKTGDRLNPQSATQVFSRLLSAAGLRHMRVHDLRHGYASLRLASGASMRMISEQLGHADPAITARLYTHLVPGAQQASIRDFDVLMRRAKSGE